MMFKSFGELPDEFNKEDFFKFPTLWPYLGYIANWAVFFFLGFVSVIMIGMEYTNKTLRQSVITGLSRRQFFLSKFSFMIAISLVATIYFALVGISIGFIHTNNVYYTKVIQNWDYIPRFFLLCIGYMSFGFFLVVWIRRTGIALFVYLVYIMFLELALRWLVHMRLFSHRSMLFYPMNATEDLLPIPIPKIVEEMAKEVKFDFLLSPLEATITTIIYSSIFLYLAYRRLQRTNL